MERWNKRSSVLYVVYSISLHIMHHHFLIYCPFSPTHCVSIKSGTKIQILSLRLLSVWSLTSWPWVAAADYWRRVRKNLACLRPEVFGYRCPSFSSRNVLLLAFRPLLRLLGGGVSSTASCGCLDNDLRVNRPINPVFASTQTARRRSPAASGRWRRRSWCWRRLIWKWRWRQRSSQPFRRSLSPSRPRHPEESSATSFRFSIA